MLGMFSYEIQGHSLISNDFKEREQITKRERNTATVRFYNEASEDYG